MSCCQNCFPPQQQAIGNKVISWDEVRGEHYSNQAQNPDSRADSLRSMHSLPKRRKKQKHKKSTSFFSWQYKDNEIWRRFGKENQKNNCILARLSSLSRAITMYWFRLGEDNHKHHAGKGQNKEMNREPRRKAVSCEFWPCYQTVPKDYHPPPAVHTMHGTAQQSLQILTLCAWHSVKSCIFGGIHTSNRRTCFISMFTSLSFSEKYHQVPEI